MSDSTNLDQSTPTDPGRRTVRPSRLLAAVAVWAGLAVIAILNAVVREILIAPVVGDYWGHVASTVTFLSGLSVVAYLYFARYTDHSVRELVAIGLIWPVMTIAFEFGFGHYVMGNPWEALLHDYNILAGRVWVLVLLGLVVAPVVFGHYLKE